MKVIHQSVFDKWPLEDCSVQAIITSPPYYSLRKYSIPDVIIGGEKDCKHKFDLTKRIANTNTPSDKSTLQGKVVVPKMEGKSIEQGICPHCNAWKGQHGLEPSYKLFLSHCKLWMQEAIRVLRDDGIIFINLADSYNNLSAQIGRQDKSKYGGKSCIQSLRGGNPDYPYKSKFLIPERFIIMCVDELGLILRNHIVWTKPNSMPESVTDRFSKKWESIFFMTKQAKYCSYLDAVREEHTEDSIRKYKGDIKLGREKTTSIYYKTGLDAGKRMGANPKLLTRGKNPGDVWNIPTTPSPEKHFAMFPEKLVSRMILCSTKVGDTVLDPFCGSGTTLRAAERYNRIGIGIDLGYQDIQQRRLSKIQKELNL